jgi:hypothetical protein
MSGIYIKMGDTLIFLVSEIFVVFLFFHFYNLPEMYLQGDKKNHEVFAIMLDFFQFSP